MHKNNQVIFNTPSLITMYFILNVGNSVITMYEEMRMHHLSVSYMKNAMYGWEAGQMMKIIGEILESR